MTLHPVNRTIKYTVSVFLVVLLGFFTGCLNNEPDKPTPDQMQLTSLRIGTSNLLASPDSPQPTNKNILIGFSHALSPQTAELQVRLLDQDDQEVPTSTDLLDNDKTIALIPEEELAIQSTYKLTISAELTGINGETFPGYAITFTTENPPLELTFITIDGNTPDSHQRMVDISLTPVIRFGFSDPVDFEELEDKVFINGDSGNASFELADEGNDSIYSISVTEPLAGYQKYTVLISSALESILGKKLESYEADFYTTLDPTPKFPVISDAELLTKIQEQTFKYFWDFGHPVSGLARERNTSGETVTTGGSGFGLMGIIVGIERGFITRQEGVERLDQIVTFLDEKADRFHGVWSHWLNGTTGDVQPFSSEDDGADLVETAFLVQGLLTVRQYLDPATPEESDIINHINKVWEDVEWDWFTQGGQNVLYWHWSPNVGWAMNHQIRGWNEALIIYVLAAASPTHSIASEVYTEGWARGGNMVNSGENSYYGYTMDLRSDRGGPLFFAHYSFLGLDPRNLSDQYANYWEQNVNHTLINRAYCIDNPKNFVSYSADCWGLTASDNHDGYSAHSPDNDLGVITPTAAISSIPYTPEESMDAIEHFYYVLGDRLWGEYGFYDAFNVTEGWTASSYLAIDQGPILVMIENHRTGLLWELFMSAPEVKSGLDKLDFNYE